MYDKFNFKNEKELITFTPTILLTASKSSWLSLSSFMIEILAKKWKNKENVLQSWENW